MTFSLRINTNKWPFKFIHKLYCIHYDICEEHGSHYFYWSDKAFCDECMREKYGNLRTNETKYNNRG